MEAIFVSVHTCISELGHLASKKMSKMGSMMTGSKMMSNKMMIQEVDGHLFHCSQVEKMGMERRKFDERSHFHHPAIQNGRQ